MLNYIGCKHSLNSQLHQTIAKFPSKSFFKIDSAQTFLFDEDVHCGRFSMKTPKTLNK